MIKGIVLIVIIFLGLSFLGVIQIGFLSGLISFLFSMALLIGLFYLFVRLFPLKDISEKAGYGVNVAIAIMLLVLYLIGMIFHLTFLQSFVAVVLGIMIVTSVFYYLLLFPVKWILRTLMGREWGNIVTIGICLIIAIKVIFQYANFLFFI